MGAFSHVDIVWEDPQTALFLRRLASFCRLLRFDRRGTGASDPLPPDPLPPWEAYAEELVAVMDAVGSQRAALLVAGPEAAPMALSFAGTRPERTAALILADATARYLVADDYPIGFPPEATEAMIAHAEELWGTETIAGIYAPSRPGDLPLWWDQPDLVAELVEEFLVGARRSVDPTRLLATVLQRRARITVTSDLIALRIPWFW
jgi:pimeloyl-ACP methyl ester carboxylesterase